jgi:GDP-fucose transporter C1
MSALHEKTDAKWAQEASDGGMSEKPPLQPISTAREPEASKGMVLFSVAFYIVAAIVMVMANKAVLNAIPVPMFFLVCQLVIAVVLLQGTAALGAFGRWLSAWPRFAPGYFTVPRITWQTAQEIAPLIAINCTGLVFNTYCLKYVDASFYQVCSRLFAGDRPHRFPRWLEASSCPSPSSSLTCCSRRGVASPFWHP